jgi:hypothetical protein
MLWRAEIGCSDCLNRKNRGETIRKALLHDLFGEIHSLLRDDGILYPFAMLKLLADQFKIFRPINSKALIVGQYYINTNTCFKKT